MNIVKAGKERSINSFVKKEKFISNLGIFLLSILLLYGVVYMGHNNYILFHALLELFSIIIAFTVFFISVNTYDISKNSYFMFIGIAYGFVAVFDLLHTFTYKGMNIFTETGANLPTQLWIIARYLESISLLVSNIFLYKKYNPKKVSFIYMTITILLLLSVFYWGIFPTSYIEGVGLTTFKKVSEYIISGILIITLIVISSNRKSFHKDISWYIILSIITTILAEILFTFYIGVYDLSNMLGHILKVISFYLIYVALVQTNLIEPHKLMFYKLNRTKEELINRNTSLKESESRFRKLIEFSPDAIVIINDDKVVFCNSAFSKLMGGIEMEDIFKKNVMDIIHPDYHKMLKLQLKAFKDKKIDSIKDFKIINDNGEILDVEISLTRLTYKDKLSTYAVIRDVTKQKRELNRAALIQKRRMEIQNPMPDYIEFEKIYMPYFAVGGDFFIFHNINEKSFRGILGDVTGKGITSALHNSALKVLFNEALSITTDPFKILDYINKEVKKYLDEDYVAACCFKFDFENSKVNICSAGINEFIHVPKGEKHNKNIIVGPFLGMLDDSPFNTKEITFKKGDRFYFNTDGFEKLFEQKNFLNKCFKLQTLEKQIECIQEGLLTHEPGHYDDSTCLGIEIK